MVNNLIGTFHCHYTIENPIDEIKFATNGLNIKNTPIHLYNNENDQIDNMLTIYYKGHIEDVKNRVSDDTKFLKDLGLKLIRSKLEFLIREDFEVSDIEFNSINYLEVHIKSKHLNEDYQKNCLKLINFVKDKNIVLSNNLNGIIRGYTYHFLNIRIKKYNLKIAKKYIDIIYKKLNNIDIEISEVKFEINVLDTNRIRDLWWA